MYLACIVIYQLYQHRLHSKSRIRPAHSPSASRNLTPPPPTVEWAILHHRWFGFGHLGSCTVSWCLIALILLFSSLLFSSCIVPYLHLTTQLNMIMVISNSKDCRSPPSTIFYTLMHCTTSASFPHPTSPHRTCARRVSGASRPARPSLQPQPQFQISIISKLCIELLGLKNRRFHLDIGTAQLFAPNAMYFPYLPYLPYPTSLPYPALSTFIIIYCTALGIHSHPSINYYCCTSTHIVVVVVALHAF
ncbi:hypothetical protein EDC01DRAFT_245805 [Geopyxis carbonaria]|nr:hypothetical protein EDC01DRAFT_245805 [Geopyxis carbonaria]